MWLLSWLFGNRKNRDRDAATAGPIAHDAAGGPVTAGEANTETLTAGDSAVASVMAAASVGFITSDYAHLTTPKGGQTPNPARTSLQGI